jgi:hypothetical protein
VPATIANSSTGSPAAVWTSATYAADPVRVSISHWAATVCIQPPMLETNWPAHIAANSRCRNGDHADAGAGSWSPCPLTAAG